MTPLVLVISAGLWVATLWRFGFTWETPAYLYLASISAPLAVIDIRELRLPNAVTVTSYPVVAGLLLLPAVADGDGGAYGRAMAAGGLVLALYVILHLVNPAGMGMGDVKLSGPLGALLGWVSWDATLWGTLIGFVLAAVTGVALMVARRAGRKTALPFGPFMLAGAWIALLALPAG
jgi:leader peptidase (prepilin peptidase)/N-methyltransferase